ncbi:MAG: DUF4198 domain-containing protein [Rhodocyclaceae bacterium]|nr:DUF4198 domain-containing protein [Rhodocyclaceae bacterium]
MNLSMKTFAAGILLAASTSVLAHAVWLERDAKGVQLYYGEYDEAKREASPGRLDDIGTPAAYAGADALAGKKGDNGWRYAAAKGADVRAEAPESPVRDWRKQGIGIVKPLFFARLADGPAAQQPVALLDLVPTGKSGAFQLFVKGQALAGVKVVVVAPNGWTREVKTDADGRFTVGMPWRGMYVLEATHLLPEPGEYKGVTYESLRLRATLSYRQAKGSATFAPAPADKLY